MKNIHKNLLLSILGTTFAFNGLEKPVAHKLFQPASLTILAASSIADMIDKSTLIAFNDAHNVPAHIVSILSRALLQRHKQKLRNILKSQIPTKIKVLDLSTDCNESGEFPVSLYPLQRKGLYVHIKKNVAHLNPERLYPGMAQLIPDPLGKNAPSHFDLIYSNPQGTKYFYDVYESCDSSTHTELKIGVWDKASGMRINNGTEIKKKILDLFPNIVSLRSGYFDFFLYGLSQDDKVAWAGFNDKDGNEGSVAFNIENNTILHISKTESIQHLSGNGRFCVVGKSILESTNPNKEYHHLHCTDLNLLEISPQDTYAFLKSETGTHILDFETEKMHELTINNQSVLLEGDTISADGSLIAILKDSGIHIIDVATNKLMYKISDPNIAEKGSCRFLFSADNTELLVFIEDTSAKDNPCFFDLLIFDIASQKRVQEFKQSEPADFDTKQEFMLCSKGDYLLLPNGELLLEPQGLINHLGLKELIGFLILEKQKTSNQTIDSSIFFQVLQGNNFPKIRELLCNRYCRPLKRCPESAVGTDFKKRVTSKDELN